MPFNLGQGAMGVAAGAPGGPIGMALGGLAGLFGGGGKPREDPVTAQSRRLSLAAQQGQMDFARSVPGSDPSELAALSQDRGALGAAQRQQQAQIYGQYNPQMGTGGLSDMLRNITNSQVGQNMSLQESHLFQALSQRRAALQEAANTGGRVAGPTYQPMSDLPQLMGQIAHSIAYQKSRNQGGGGNGASVSATPAPVANQSPYTQADYNTQYDPQQAAADQATKLEQGAGTSAILGGLPPPLYTQPEAATPGAQQASIQNIPQPVNAMGGGYNIDGRATMNNQWRQTSPFLRFG
jgi:hypothetical protein